MNEPSTATLEGNGKKEPTESTPKEKDPVFVSTEDRLFAVNQHLRVQTLMKDEQLIRSEFMQLSTRRQLVQTQLRMLEGEIEVNLKELQGKYGINLQTHEIQESDGMVVPKKGLNQLEQLRRQMSGG